MQQFLKPAAGFAGARIVAAKFLEELLVPVHDATAAFDSGFGGNPLRRLLVASKPELVEVFGFGIHGTPPI
jgi:hypothetical protein